MTDTPNISVHKIALIGGTGKEGKGLAYRWAKAGYDIVIGSRQIEKAQATAAELLALLPDARIEGLTNDAAAQTADLLVLTVPFGAHTAMCEAIRPYAQGKVVIDVTVPLVPPKVTKVQMPPAGSAAQEAQQILGDQVSVVAAFQNISYEHLLQDETVNCDVLVCGTGKSARQVVLNLVAQAGMVNWDTGPIENSVVVEGLTSVLIGLNKQFDTHSAGIRITGVPRPDEK